MAALATGADLAAVGDVAAVAVAAVEDERGDVAAVDVAAALRGDGGDEGRDEGGGGGQSQA